MMSRDHDYGYESIFDKESELLGRPLNGWGKSRVISKYTAIIGFWVTVPFLLVDYWEVSHTYDEPKIFLLENMAIQVIRGNLDPEARIILYNNGVQKFSSSCKGLDEFICHKNEFWRLSEAKLIQFIEHLPNRGIIKKIVIPTSSGDREFTNLAAENYIENFSKKYI